MPSKSSRTDSDTLDWPVGWDRTPSHERTQDTPFETSIRQSIDTLAGELERIGVDEWHLSTAAEHQKANPQYPYTDANPADPGAVVRWSRDEDQYAVACDSYARLRDNIRTLSLYIREKRKMENQPVQTGESEFANVRLPPTEDVSDSSPDHPPHVILGVPPDADPSTVRDAFRRLVKAAHPDNGGSEEEFRRVCEAKKALLT